VPVLGLDTASARGSIALARPGEILAQAALEERAWHARDLVIRIDGLLREAGLTAHDLAGIGVAVGPGSFTGVRIGMATAKGLAYSLDIGLAGLSTLEALARATLGSMISPPLGAICPAIQAGRGEVYAALFRTERGELVREVPDRSWRPVDLARALPPGTLLVGDGAGPVLEAVRVEGRSAEPHPSTPALAPAIALWTCRAVPEGTVYRPGTLGPNYVRPADAEAPRRRS
jgi:tRNA threonylcarbamoyladenosine biosynthesis protein TsaB